MADLITYYADENVHPRFQAAFKWFEDEVLDERMKSCEQCSSVTLAGGALRSFFTGTRVRDYDIYGTKDQIKCLMGSLTGAYNWVKTSDTDRSVTYRYKMVDVKKNEVTISPAMNIVKKSFANPQDILETFDFTVCMCAINKSQITFHPDYFTDLATKTLRFNRLEEPVLAMWRLQKYVKLGFEMSREEMWKLAEAVYYQPALPAVIKPGEEKKKGAEEVTLEELFRVS